MASIQLLVTLNENYIPQLKVMLTSLHQNDPMEAEVWLLHRSIPEEALSELGRFTGALGFTLRPLRVDGELFEGAPVTRQYPQEMYYRLLAPSLLPEELDRVLYLDPDLLVINPIRPLWELELGDSLFAAAAHTGKTELANNVNRLRLGTETAYFNSGVLLINLAAGRKEIRPADIFQAARERQRELILPDQDILNLLYSGRTLPLDDFIWNYDARKFSNYYLRSNGQANLDWVMEHTAILHFCGKAKPWKKVYSHRFGVLYKHYMRLAARREAQLVP